MGVLNTIDTILSVMENEKDIMTLLEPIVLNVIGLILTQSVVGEYSLAVNFMLYELNIALSQMYNQACKSIGQLVI